MQSRRPALCLTGAQALIDQELVETSLGVEEGRLTDAALREVDMSGYMILPGIIDLHGDAFERHMAPRPTAPFPMRTGLVGTDRDAAANGVTTAWMAQSWSWEGGARGPDHAEEFMAAHADYKSRMLTDLHIQLRVETHTMDTQSRLVAAMDKFKIDYAVFNNHLSEAIELAEQQPEMIHAWAKKSGRTSEEHMALVRAADARSNEVPRYLCNLATAFDRMGVRYGSHDDPDGATRERFSMIGAKVCEFPTSLGAAIVARAWDEPVIMGAPNVVRGGSQSGNVAATVLIAEGCCDVLVSDYYYPALAQAAFKLADEGVMSLPQAWAMISSRPAEVMGLDDRGDLISGQRADLVLVNTETRLIEATMSNGRWTHLCGGAAERLLSHESSAIGLAAE